MIEFLRQHPELAALIRDILIAVLSAILGALQGRAAARREIARARKFM